MGVLTGHSETKGGTGHSETEGGTRRSETTPDNGHSENKSKKILIFLFLSLNIFLSIKPC